MAAKRATEIKITLSSTRLSQTAPHHLGGLMMIETSLAVAKAISEPLDFGGSMLGFQLAAAFMTGVLIAGFGVVAVRPTTLLTYGWLFAFAMISPATANRLNGAATMMTFRMCSLPMIATLRFGVQPAAGSPRKYARNHASLAVSWPMLWPMRGHRASVFVSSRRPRRPKPRPEDPRLPDALRRRLDQEMSPSAAALFTPVPASAESGPFRRYTLATHYIKALPLLDPPPMTALAMNSDGIALIIVFSLLSLVAFIAIFFKAVRKEGATFAPCIVVITLVFTIIGVGLISTAAYRVMGY